MDQGHQVGTYPHAGRGSSRFATAVAVAAALIIIGSTPARAAPDPAARLQMPNLTSMAPKNGIDPAAYDHFWDRWSLVTVRYRMDNGEQRFIYANEVAAAALKNGAPTFPDGAVLAKVAFATADDPKFPNSRQTRAVQRIQFMVKQANKYRGTNGWGYWLYVTTNKDAPAEGQDDTAACHACHTLVKNRDYVFARPTFVASSAPAADDAADFLASFKTRSVANLAGFIKAVANFIPAKPAQIQLRTMPLFSGSLDESIGPLAQYAKGGQTFLLVDERTHNFVIAEPAPGRADCPDGVTIYLRHQTPESPPAKPTYEVLRGTVCHGVNKWIGVIPLPANLN